MKNLFNNLKNIGKVNMQQLGNVIFFGTNIVMKDTIFRLELRFDYSFKMRLALLDIVDEYVFFFDFANNIMEYVFPKKQKLSIEEQEYISTKAMIFYKRIYGM